MVETTMELSGWLRKPLEQASPELLRAMGKRRTTGKEKEMGVLYDEGVASRLSAPSRASAAREGGGEASVGVVQAG